ncbi:MAG: hypothetical protein IRZ03_13140 [Acidobacterium ailaaui]|nr:hypothetical protein [Pseudacidobacterium ailaaui]
MWAQSYGEGYYYGWSSSYDACTRSGSYVDVGYVYFSNGLNVGSYIMSSNNNYIYFGQAQWYYVNGQNVTIQINWNQGGQYTGYYINAVSSCGSQSFFIHNNTSYGYNGAIYIDNTYISTFNVPAGVPAGANTGPYTYNGYISSGSHTIYFNFNPIGVNSSTLNVNGINYYGTKLSNQIIFSNVNVNSGNNTFILYLY